MTWVVTIVSILAAVTDGLQSLLRGSTSSYDPELGVLTMTLIAIVWYTRYTYEALHLQRTRDDLERVRRRRILSTAVLAELSWLEPALLEIQERGPQGRFDALEAPALRSALDELHLFSVEAAERLTHFNTLLYRARATMLRWQTTREARFEEYLAAKNPHPLAALEQMLPHDFVRNRAAWAQRQVAPLVSVLVAEGGVMPSGLGEAEEAAGALVPTSPPSFESHSRQ